IPDNLLFLHAAELDITRQITKLAESDGLTLVHFQMAESAMDVLDAFRKFPKQSDDFEVVQYLALRQFNSLASSIRLLMSGYYQSAALMLRDCLETVFLVELFQADAKAIALWRLAGTKRKSDWGAVNVRRRLEELRAGDCARRKQLYAQFSELAG